MNADINNRSNAIRDSLEIYDYYSSNYSYQKIIKKDQKFKTIKTKWGRKETYDIKATDDISLYLSNSIRKNRIKYTDDGITELNYKIKKGDKLGTVTVTYEDSTLTKYDVYLNEKIEYYHPVLYLLIICATVTMLLSLEVVIHKHKKKKRKKQLKNK